VWQPIKALNWVAAHNSCFAKARPWTWQVVHNGSVDVPLVGAH
jgi:hypothetical protein